MNLNIGAKQHIQLADHPDFVRFPLSEIQQSIPQKFEKQVRLRPNDIAVVADGRSRTYERLNKIANRLAHAIQSIAGEKSEPVVLLLDQGLNAVEAILATLKAGKIYVTLDPSFPAYRLRGTITECKASIILTDTKHCRLANELAESTRRVLYVDEYPIDNCETNPRLSIDADQPCYIYYTSGSTGQAKGVVDCHRNVLHNVMRYTNSLKIGHGDRLSLIQSFSFSGTVSTLFAGLLNGAQVHLFDLQKNGIERLASWMKEHRITIYHSVPAIFERLFATGERFPSLRLIRLEGDQCHMRHVAAYQERFGSDCVLVNGLGATETGLTRQLFITPKTSLSGSSVPIGFSVDDMEVLLLGKDGRPVPQGEIGEITVRSHYLAQGYWQRPDLTQAAFEVDREDKSKRLYRSGDLGRMGAHNCLEFLGRSNRRASPAAIQDRLRSQRSYEAPQSELEQLVASCFENVLSVDLVGRSDDLFELEADSLQITELFLLLEEKTGRSLSVDVALQASTVEALARALSTGAAETPLVSLQALGSNSPLFCIHNYPGTVLEYGLLAQSLGSEQPVYGLRCADDPPTAGKTIESMAAQYIEEIRRVRSHGPYNLCGNCFGGVVVFEMAQQLTRAGETVALLALIDTAFPVSGLRLVGRQLNLARNWRLLRNTLLQNKVRFVVKRFIGFGSWVSREMGRRKLAKSQHSSLSFADINRLAEKNYRPSAYDGPAVLYCIGRPHNQRGWRKVIKSNLDIVELPPQPGVDDDTHIVSEPYVRDLVRDIRQRLKR